MTTYAPMPTYIGTKLVRARPMNRQAYNDLRGWTVPADENPADEGYLVEYTDGGKANVPGYDGYISWSPREQFANTYVLIDGLGDLQPHQWRVVAEKADLDHRKAKLSAFTQTAIFESLPTAERDRLLKQLEIMIAYSVVLGERIAAFKAVS